MTDVQTSSSSPTTNVANDIMEKSTISRTIINKKRQVDYPALDGLRGILMILIVLGHITQYYVSYDLNSINAAPVLAYFGIEFLSPVTFFIIMSGFTLTLVYNKPVENNKPLTVQIVWQFFYKRFIRLAPMYYLSLILGIPFLLYINTNIPILTVTVVTTPLMLQSLAVGFAYIWNGPLWTVSVLAICYLFFPLWLKRLQNYTSRTLWIISGVSFFISILVATAWLVLIPFLSLILHTFTIFRFPQFVMGMCSALLLQQNPPKNPAMLVWISTLILLVNFCACFAVVGVFAPAYSLQQGWSLFAEWYLAPIQCMMLVGLASPLGTGGFIQWGLSTRGAILLGNWSYAVYCLHFPLLLLLGYAVKGGVTPILWSLGTYPFPIWSIPLLVLFILVISAFAHYFIENPLSAYLRPVEGSKNIPLLPQNTSDSTTNSNISPVPAPGVTILSTSKSTNLSSKSKETVTIV